MIENPKLVAVKLAEKLDCPISSSQAIIDCLKTIPAEEIVQAEITVGYFNL